MNRTVIFLAAALCLGLIALVVKAPGANPPAPPPPQPEKKVELPRPPPPQPPQPASKPGSLTLSGKLSHPYVTPGSSDVFATLEVNAVDVPGARRAPVNMAVVFDRSGSMAGAKLANAKRAANELLDRLDDRDSLAIVHFGSDVKSLPSMKVTDENRERMRRFIARMIDDGGTNIGAGLKVGEQQLQQASCEGCIKRLVLMSDGQPTEGIASLSGLSRIVSQMHERGVSVTALGVGYDFNEDLMTQLASVGGGSYAYLKDSAALASIVRKDLQQASTLVARDVRLNLRMPQGVSFREVLGRPYAQNGANVTVTLPDFSARQVEKLVVHLGTLAPSNDGAALDVADFSLDYRDVLADHDADSKLKLAAMVTMDRTLADARRDREAVVTATRAQAAVNYKKAADEVAVGRYAEARKTLEKNNALFFEAERVAGAPAVAADKADNAQAFGLVEAAPQAAPMQLDAVKAMKVQSQRASGAGASLY